MTKPLLSIFVGLMLLGSSAYSQNLGGMWVGKLSQGPGDGMSRLYDFELQLKQKKNNRIDGESYGHIDDSVRFRIAISGTVNKDSLVLHERDYMILDTFVISPWQLCVKNLRLTYRQEGGYEYLQGSWDGRGLDDFKNCEPGNVILSRRIEDVELFLANGGITNTNPIVLAPVAEFTSGFVNTNVAKVRELEVHNRAIQIRLSDYKNIDDDTVSVYLNRKPLAKNMRIARNPVRLSFYLDNRTDLHEILLYAENLGKIPPNTSLMEVIDGDKKYQIKIESDKQKTAAVYLRYKPQ